MRYESSMMMAGPTTIAAPRMDQPTGVVYNPPSIPASSSTSRRPSLPHHPSSGSSSSQPHRRGSTATTSSRHRSHRHQSYQQQQQQQQPQFLFYPQIIPYQQMPYHQQLPYQHQRMHNLLHGNVNSYQPLPYNNPYQAVHQSQSQQPRRSQSSLSHRRPSHPPSQPSLPLYQSQSQRPTTQNRHLRRPHLLPPNAPPSSQQHSSSSSFSSQQQLAKQAQATATQVKAETKEEAPVATTTTMPLFAGFSLRGSKQNKMARADKKEETEKKAQKPEQQKQTATTTVLSASIKPPVRKSDPVGRNRGPVDAKDLAQRLQTILAERGMQQPSSSGITRSSVPASPLGDGPPPPVQNGGRRIRSRGSGNLRAVYASNAPIVPTTTKTGVDGPIRRQPFSAPHSLSAYQAAKANAANNVNNVNNAANVNGLGLVPPPTMDELQRRKNRTQSQSPQQAQVNMRGGGLSSSGGGLTMSDTQDTLAQRRAVTSVIPPTSAHHGVPYIPSQAAQQFQRTTHSVGGPRKSILLQKPKSSPKEPNSHNQSVAKSPTLSQKSSQKGKVSPTMSAKSPVTPSSARAPSVKHAFKDTLAEPGSRRQSMKESAEAAKPEKAEAEVDADATALETGEEADDEATADAETDLEADKAKADKTAAAGKKPVAASDLSRIVQEHSVDWTQSDEKSIQRKREKKEKKEREKREKKAKAKQQQTEVSVAGEEGQGRPMWRLKARLSSFSKDKRSPSPPVTVTAVTTTTTASVPEEDKTVTSTAPEEGATVEETKAAEPTSNSSSVLSLAAMRKSSSFLALFKH